MTHAGKANPAWFGTYPLSRENGADWPWQRPEAAEPKLSTPAAPARGVLINWRAHEIRQVGFQAIDFYPQPKEQHDADRGH